MEKEFYSYLQGKFFNIDLFLVKKAGFLFILTFYFLLFKNFVGAPLLAFFYFVLLKCHV